MFGDRLVEIALIPEALAQVVVDVGEGGIELDIGGNSFNFQWAELAPPSGVMAANYSR